MKKVLDLIVKVLLVVLALSSISGMFFLSENTIQFMSYFILAIISGACMTIIYFIENISGK